MWNPFKKLPHTRERYEEAEKEVRDKEIKKIPGKWKPNPFAPDINFVYETTPSEREFEEAERKQDKLKIQGHKEALKLENKYQNLLEELEEARKAGENVEEKEDALRDFEEKELGMKVDRPRHHQGPYR